MSVRIAALLPLAGLLLAGCTDAEGGGNEVRATNEGGRDRFDPPALRIEAGGTVAFVDERGSHTVDFVEAHGVSVPSSGNLDPGDRHEVRFEHPGTFHYYCKYHSSGEGTQRTGMVGTVTVAAEA